MPDQRAILDFCRSRLDVDSYQDIAINGLQVEGRATINRIAVAVSTSTRTISAAVDWQADALLVHHGLLWDGRVQPLTGVQGSRFGLLFKHDINLIAYHLPLDGHPELGNNARLARLLNVEVIDRFGAVAGMELGVVCSTSEPCTVTDLASALASELHRPPVVLGATDHIEDVDRIAIMSGSGHSTLEEVASIGCQILITGDVREPTMAEARELGIVAIAAGHEATERLGVQALSSEIVAKFDVETRFFDDPNPV